MRYILTAGALALILPAGAQNLKTEIDVDRTIVPQEREADRPASVAPALLATPKSNATLKPAEYLLGGNATTSMPLLPPAQWQSSVAHSPYRGYASIGYFPAFNLGANAGYRVIDTDKTQLGVWLQYDGNKYKGERYNTPTSTPISDKVQIKQNFLTLGADGSHALSDGRSSIAFGLDYTHAALSLPRYADFPNYDQKANSFNANASWQSRVQRVAYSIGAKVDHFAFGSNPYNANALKQTGFNATAGAGLCLDGEKTPWAGVDLTLDMLRTNLWETPSGYASQTLSEVYLKPYARFGKDGFNARIGLNLSFAGGGDPSSKVHIAPDIRLSYAAKSASVYLNIDGAERINRASAMFWRNPYYDQYSPLPRTNIPVNFEVGFNAGPFAGFSAGLFGGYAIADHWFMPDRIFGWLDIKKIKSGRLGVKAQYDYKELATIKVSYQAGFSTMTTDDPIANSVNTWMMWDDYSRSRLDASVDVRPIQPLTLTLAYQLRSGCHLAERQLSYDISSMPTIGETTTATIEFVDKQNVGLLTLRAAYQINQQLSVFAIGENLANCRYHLVSGLPAQGICGLVGLAAKF